MPSRSATTSFSLDTSSETFRPDDFPDQHAFANETQKAAKEIFVFLLSRSDQNKRIKLLVSKSKAINKIRCFITRIELVGCLVWKFDVIYFVYGRIVWMLILPPSSEVPHVIHETILKTWLFYKLTSPNTKQKPSADPKYLLAS